MFVSKNNIIEIHEKLYLELVEQVSCELNAQIFYLNLSQVFDSIGLKNLSKFAIKQSNEELQHAMKIIGFLQDNGVFFQVDVSYTHPEIVVIDPPYQAVNSALQEALESEIKLSTRINTLFYKAREHKMTQVEQFLQWFIEEQVEEIAQCEDLISQLKICSGNLLLLDNSDFVKGLLAK